MQRIGRAQVDRRHAHGAQRRSDLLRRVAGLPHAERQDLPIQRQQPLDGGVESIA